MNTVFHFLSHHPSCLYITVSERRRKGNLPGVHGAVNDPRLVSQIDLAVLLRDNTEVRFPPSAFLSALLWFLIEAVSLHVIGARFPSDAFPSSLSHGTPTLKTEQSQAESREPVFTQRSALGSDLLLQRHQQNSQGARLLQTGTRAPSVYQRHTLRWISISLPSPSRLFLFRRQCFPSPPADDPFHSSSLTRLL